MRSGLNLSIIAINTRVTCSDGELSQWFYKHQLEYLVIYLVIILKTDITMKGVLHLSKFKTLNYFY